MMAQESSLAHCCYICNKEYSCVSSRNLHIRQVHGEGTMYLNSRVPSCCPLCAEFQFTRKKEFHHHLQRVHDIKLESMNLTFPTLEEFDKWKEAMEVETDSVFIKEREFIVQRDGVRRLVFKCHRSGNYKSRSAGLRALKTQGTCKLNATCPANIVANVGGENVDVTFLGMHCGHSPNDVGHLRLTKSDKLAIVRLLTSGMDCEKILEEIRNDVTYSLKRKRLVTKKDLRNIKRRFTANDTNDSKVANDWINQTRLGSNGSVLPLEHDGSGVQEDVYVIIETDQQQRLTEIQGSDEGSDDINNEGVEQVIHAAREKFESLVMKCQNFSDAKLIFEALNSVVLET